MKDRNWLVITAVAIAEGLTFHLQPSLGWPFVTAILIAALQELVRNGGETAKYEMREACTRQASSQVTTEEAVPTTIVDITRAFTGTERRLVEAVLERHNAEQRGRTIVLGFDSHAAELGPVSSMVEFRSAGGWSAETDVNHSLAQMLSTLAGEGAATPFRVFSFHHSVLNRLGSLAEFAHLFTAEPLRGYANPRGNTGQEEWPESIIPLEEALASLERGLMNQNGRPLFQSEVRPMLASQDPRFRKDAHPLLRKGSIISLLLSKARDRQMIEIFGHGASVQLRLAQGGSAAWPPQSVLPTQQTNSSTSQVRVFEPAQEGRSKQFNKILRDHRNFGPFPETRTDFYKHLIEASSDITEPFSARGLCREAAKRTQDKAPEYFPRANADGGGIEGFPKDKYPFDKLEEFGLRALARAGFLRADDGSSIGDLPFLLADAKINEPLPHDLYVHLDAEVVLVVLQKTLLRWPEDRRHLAGALYNTRAEESQDRIDQVIAHLHRTGKVAYNADDETLMRA
jgi:hypothetical protein